MNNDLQIDGLPSWIPQGSGAPRRVTVFTAPTRLPGPVLTRSLTLFGRPQASLQTLTPAKPIGSQDGPRLIPSPAKLSTLQVAYNGFPPAVQSAFDYAVDLYESLIRSSVPIRVSATWKPLSPGVIASSSPAWVVRDFAAGRPNTWYPVALANRLVGKDLIPNGFDIEVNLSSAFRWYLGTDAKPGNNQIDLVSIVLHELLHGLGTIGSMSISNGIASWGLGTSYPMIYDRFVENGAGQNLANTNIFANHSVALGSQLTSNNLYFDGAGAVAGFNGTRPKLFAPLVWQGGSSISHLDENTFPRGTANALNTPYFTYGEAVHSLGPITTGLLRDLGWSVVLPPTLSITAPSPTKAEGRTGATPFTFTVQRSGSLAGPSSVQWAVVGTGVSSANASDFNGPTSGLLTFSPNQASRTLTLSLKGDISQEANETFSVRLSAPTGATLRGTFTAGTILNDDRIGNANPNTLQGTALAEFIDGRANVDTLTGGAGFDVFGFRFSESPLNTPDRITDFAFGADRIDLLSTIGGGLAAPVSLTRASNNTSASSLSALTSAVFADADGARAGRQALGVNSAVLVQATQSAIAGTYLLINNATPGRSITEDLLIHLSGFTGTLPPLGAMDPSRLFV